MHVQVGVISDIHADLEGLRLALRLLDFHGVMRTVCAGDIVERGTGGDTVANLIRERAIVCIKGNHEYIAVSKQEEMHRRGSAVGLRHRPLSEGTVAFLHALPDSYRFEQAGKRILVAHGTPWSDFVYVYPESRPATFERVAREAQADVVILGHTHIPMRACVGGVWIFNPGSISAAGSRTCGILTLPDCAFDVYSLDSGRQVPDVPFVTIDRRG